MTGVPTEAQIIEVLGEHAYIRGIRDTKAHCNCGWSGPRSPNAHRAHVAAVLSSTVLQPLTEERDALAQAMWDGWAALGFDTDGDTHPGAWIAGAESYAKFAEQWLRDIRQHRTDADQADEEWSTDIDRLDAAVAGCDRLRDGITALADEWAYKGEFGWGPWQAGEGPDFEGQVLDSAASALRELLKGNGA